jgi:rod shape-determining protein MreC
MTPWLVIVLLLANFMLMAFDAREITSGQRIVRVWSQSVASFVQSPVSSLSSGATDYFGSIANLRSAQDENDQLKSRVQELEMEKRGSESLASENDRLRALLSLKEKTTSKVIYAQIIGRDPSAWFDSAIIDLGSLNGVKLNMPVVSDGGLVGRVTAVGPLSAQFDLITRDKSGVGGVVGEIGSSNILGVVAGTGKQDLVEMKYVPGSAEIQSGQIVYTTGQDGIYPAGLKIGEIIEVRTGSATVPHQIFIRPSAGINSVKEVGVLLYEPPEKKDFDQKLPNAIKTPKK